MRFVSACAAAIAVLSFTSSCLATAISLPLADLSSTVEPPLITTAPVFLHSQARAAPKRQKYMRHPPKKAKRPFKRPKPCTNTELFKNGDFDKNVRRWDAISVGPGYSQFFWVKDSKKRPAHSGEGQAYLFLSRGFTSIELQTTLPAVEYGNVMTISVWMRYEAPADVSSCRAEWIVPGEGGLLPVTLNPQWTKYSLEVPGYGRPEMLRFAMSCESLETPLTVYLDDVSVKACVPQNPDPECQVLKGSDNLLVNPGFECPDGMNAWQTRSNSEGTDSLVQFGSQRGNPTHSGKAMAGFVFDSTKDPGTTGLSIFQWGLKGELSRTSMKAVFWLSVDSKASNVTGCMLTLATRTGLYLYDYDLGYLTTKWTKIEVKDIVPHSLDDLTIEINWCTSPVPPLIYIDDIYFGVDRASPPATNTVTTPTEPTTTSTPEPCTVTPSVLDPSMELDDNMNNWMQFNGDALIYPDSESTYGPPHDGNSVAVVQLPPNPGDVSLSQYVSGFCGNAAYSASVWLYIPTAYDPTICNFRLGVTGASELFQVSRAGVWEKIEFAFFVEEWDASNPFLRINIGIFCETPSEMIVLVDDIRFGGPPPCTVTPSITDGGFESGNTSNWDIGFYQGDETIAYTNAKPHTGKKSAALTFPKTSNGVNVATEFEACVGVPYTFRFWYFIPKAYKDTTCKIGLYAFYTGESVGETVTVFDSWVEAKLDFTAGGTAMTVIWWLVCSNQLQKMVVYIDDVSITKR